MALTKVEELDLLNRLIEARRGSLSSQYPLQSRYGTPEPKKSNALLRKADSFARGGNMAAADLLGFPVDAAHMALNALAGLVGKELPTPVGGSESISKLFGGLADRPADADLADKIIYEGARFGGGLAAGTAASKLPMMAKSPMLAELLGAPEWTTAKATKIGALSGAGYAIGDEVGGPLGGLAGMFLAPMTPTKIPSILKKQTGAVSMSPSALSQAWQSTVGSKLMSLGHKAGQLPLVPRDSRVARWMGGNTFNEWAYAPQERMAGVAAQQFRDVRSEAERASTALRETAMSMKGLNLEERESLRNVMRGGFDINQAPAQHQQKIMDLLKPVQDAGTITGRKLYTSPNRQMMVQNELDKHLLKVFAEDPQNPLWQTKKMFAGQFDLTTEKGTMQFLDGMLKDPLTPPEVKTIARDLYDLPAKTASEVADAHRRAYESLLISDLKNNPALVVPQTHFMQQLAQAQQGGNINAAQIKQIRDQVGKFVEIPNHPEFQGLLVERNVAEGIRDLDTHVSNFRRGWNKYYLNPWKFMKIGLNIPARARDMFSNFMFNDIYGKHPLSPYRVDVYGSALKDLIAASRGKSVPELERYFFHSGGKIDALNSVATDPIFSAMRHDANPLDSALGMLYSNPVSKLSSNIMKNADLWSKYSKFKHNLANGMPEEEAIVDAMRATGNMLEQSRAIRNVRDTAMPFFGWSAHAGKTIMHGMANHPIRTAKWYLGPLMAAQYAIDELDMTDEEWQQFNETLPDYMKESVLGMPTRIPMPSRDEKGRIQMLDIGWWIPGLQDLSELNAGTENPMRFMQNPMFTAGASLLTNKKFSGAPIYNDWDDNKTKYAKRLMYIAQQHLPPMTPYIGNQAIKIADAFKGEDPNALTEGQALGTQIGYRVTPVDLNTQYKKYAAKYQAWSNEAKHQMREELNKTQDPEDQQAIIDRYQEIFQRLMEEKMNLPGDE